MLYIGSATWSFRCSCWKISWPNTRSIHIFFKSLDNKLWHLCSMIHLWKGFYLECLTWSLQKIIGPPNRYYCPILCLLREFRVEYWAWKWASQPPWANYCYVPWFWHLQRPGVGLWAFMSRVILHWGTILCTIGHSAASLASTYRKPGGPPTLEKAAQNSSQLCQVPPGA